ncbi:MAG: 50S ribosomal protein L28 [Candidatus Levybacteria bacterium]|nr:50S ribosomal protein L28 [Candidatus Levybacteria bacterium]
MAMQCTICHKGVQYGHNVSHSKRRTPRVFRPNLHSAKIVVDGATQRVKLCTKCLRMYKKVVAAANEKVDPQGEVAPVAA